MSTPRDLAIQRDLIPRESRHAIQNRQQKYHVLHCGSFGDVSVPILVLFSSIGRVEKPLEKNERASSRQTDRQNPAIWSSAATRIQSLKTQILFANSLKRVPKTDSENLLASRIMGTSGLPRSLALSSSCAYRPTAQKYSKLRLKTPPSHLTPRNSLGWLPQ